MTQISDVLRRVLKEELIPEEQAANLTSYYRECLADIMSVRLRRDGEPIVLGICGSQGSGKSTMARVLQEALRQAHGLSVAVMSLDDLYLSVPERARLAHKVHPLLKTRGVPGTHDVELGMRVIRRLVSAHPKDTTRLPRFDKARDEPCTEDIYDVFHGRADLVVFEGWCVGAIPQEQSALANPVNTLERDFDPDGRWRRYVNDQLAGPYRALFDLLDRLLMIQAPGFEVVFDWRREQELKLKARLGPTCASTATRPMDDEELRRFIMHYERLTRHTLAEMPGRADILVKLNAQRRIVAIDKPQPLYRSR